MKKFYSLLVLFLALCVGSSRAATTATFTTSTVDDLPTAIAKGAVYLIKGAGSGNSTDYIVWNTTINSATLTQTTTLPFPSGSYGAFQIIASTTADQYYIYCIGVGYLTCSNSDSGENKVTITEQQTDATTWYIVNNGSSADGKIDIVPSAVATSVDDVTDTNVGWNIYGGVATGRGVGLYDRSDGNSAWTLVQTIPTGYYAMQNATADGRPTWLYNDALNSYNPDNLTLQSSTQTVTTNNGYWHITNNGTTIGIVNGQGTPIKAKGNGYGTSGLYPYSTLTIGSYSSDNSAYYLTECLNASTDWTIDDDITKHLTRWTDGGSGAADNQWKFTTATGTPYTVSIEGLTDALLSTTYVTRTSTSEIAYNGGFFLSSSTLTDATGFTVPTLDGYETPTIALDGNTIKVTYTLITSNVTYQIYLSDVVDANGSARLYKTVTVLTPIGSTPAVTEDYVTISSYSSTDAITGETTIQAYGTQALPFTVSSSADATDASWYIVDISNSNNTWAYDNSSTEKSVSIITGYDKSQTTLEDKYLWCFTGNLIDGFNIYNKEAGSTMSLTTGTNYALLNTDPATAYKLVKTTTDVANGMCFQDPTSNEYLNDQNSTLDFWGEADNGSTCRVYPAAQFMLTYYNNNLVGVMTNTPDGAVGAYTADSKTALTSAATTATSSPANYDNAKALSNALAGLTSDGTTFKAGYYRLVNYNDNKYLNLYLNGSNYLMNGNADAGLGVYSVFKFEETATEGQYAIKVQGRTLGQTTRSNPVYALENTSSTLGEYKVTTYNNISCIFVMQDVTTTDDASYHYLHENDGNLVGWAVDAGASHWYIVPAEEVNITLNTADGKSYATTYMPFPIGLSETDKAGSVGLYFGPLNSDKSELDLISRTNFPAETGVVVMDAPTSGSPKTSLTLQILDDADVPELDRTNALTGTLLGTTEVSGKLVFGRKLVDGSADDTQVGFFAPASSVTSIGANKAYIESTISTAIRMNFGGQQTGIDTIFDGVEMSNAPIFDLSGRRVMKTIKGNLYIQGGTKFIAQ